MRKGMWRALLRAHGARGTIELNSTALSQCVINLCREESRPCVSASYKIDKERKLVLSFGEGVLTREDILGHMERLSKDPDFDPDFSQLADFREVAGMEFGPKDVRDFAERDIFSPRAHRALIVKNDVQFGFARMFEIHREMKGETGIRVFRDFDEALDWILAAKTTS